MGGKRWTGKDWEATNNSCMDTQHQGHNWTGKNQSTLRIAPEGKGEMGNSWRQKHEGNCDERISHAQNAQIGSGAARFSADLICLHGLVLRPGS